MSAAQTSHAGPGSKSKARCEAIFQESYPFISHRKNPDSALIAADRLEAAATRAGDLAYLGRAFYLRGSAYSYQHKPDLALQNFKDAVRCFETSHDSSYLGRSYYSIAAHLYQDEDLKSAQIQAQNAAQVAARQQDTVLQAHALNLFALIQKALGNYQAAIDYLEQSSIHIEIHHKIKLVQNLGIIYKDLEQFENAANCFLQVINHLEDRPNHPSLPIALNNLATVRLRQEKSREALTHLSHAQSILGPQSSPRIQTLIYMNQGFAHQQLKECDQALPYYRKARQRLMEFGGKYDLATNLENEAHCLRESGRASQAYDLLEQAQTIRDSLQDLERDKSIAEMEQKFRQADQKQRIENLEHQNQLILERETATRRALRNQNLILALLGAVLVLLILIALLVNRVQKSRLLQRNEADKQQLLRQQIKPHFIFNALNSIQLFLLHDRKKEAVVYLGKFGALLRLILNNAEKDLVPVAEELQLLQHYLEMEQIRTSHKFDFEISTENGVDPENILMPGMILQVITENAIWHGAGKAKAQGMIQVRVSKSGDHYLVSVEDNGPGLRPDDMPTSPLRRSLGLSLVRSRIKRSSQKGASFGFDLQNITGEQGQILGTRAQIILRGSPIFA